MNPIESLSTEEYTRLGAPMTKAEVEALSDEDWTMRGRIIALRQANEMRALTRHRQVHRIPASLIQQILGLPEDSVVLGIAAEPLSMGIDVLVGNYGYEQVPEDAQAPYGDSVGAHVVLDDAGRMYSHLIVGGGFDPATFHKVNAEVEPLGFAALQRAERRRQTDDLGYTAEHDDAHNSPAFADFIEQRVEELGRVESTTEERALDLFAQIAALAEAAGERILRKQAAQSEETPDA